MSTLEQYLKTTGETQAKFAIRVGMSQGNIAKLCGADPRLSLDAALKIEKATDGHVQVETWPQFTGLASRRGPDSAPWQERVS